MLQRPLEPQQDGNWQPSHPPRNSQSYPKRSGSGDQERIAMLEERFFAHDKSLGKQIRSQNELLQQLEDAQRRLEERLESQGALQNAQSKLEQRMQELEASCVKQELAAPPSSSASQSEVREHDSDNQNYSNLENSSGLAELLAESAEVKRWREQVDDRLIDLERYVKLEKADLERGVSDHAPANEPLSESVDKGKDIDETVIGTGEVDMGPGEVDSEEAEQPIGESLWEVALLICLDAISPACSVMLVIGTVLNVCIQFVFCAIVYANMMEGSIDQTAIDALHHWRGVVGHSMQYWDRVAQTTLVAQLCEEDQALTFSASQSAAYSSITSFISPSNTTIRDLGLMFLDGRLLCVIALFLWLLFTGCDMVDNFNFLCAVIQQPRGHGHLIRQEDGSYNLNMLGTGQLIAFLSFAFVPRFIMASLLAAIGVKFLASTEDVEELLLNALALTFILDIDEIMYAAMVPYRVKTIVAKLAPLTFRWRFPVQGGLWYVIVRTIVAVVAVIVVNLTLLHTHNEDLTKARDALCGGEKNFVFAVDKASGVVQFASSTPFSQVYSSTYQKEAVLELTRNFVNGDSSGVSMSMEVELTDVIETYEGTTFSAAVKLKCLDLDDVNYPAHMKDSSHAVLIWLDPNLVNCSMVEVEDCANKRNTNVRALCPKTCGCHNAWSGLFYGSTSYGCPAECDPNYATSLHLHPFKGLPGCTDVPSNVLMLDEGWQRYINATRVIASGSSCVEFIDQGCSYVADCRTKGFDMCKPNSGLVGRSARPWCPQTCLCGAGKEECPPTCGCIFGAEFRDSNENTCMSVQNADTDVLGSVSASVLPGWAVQTWGSASASNLPGAIIQGDGSSAADGDGWWWAENGSVGDGAGSLGATNSSVVGDGWGDGNWWSAGDGSLSDGDGNAVGDGWGDGGGLSAGNGSLSDGADSSAADGDGWWSAGDGSVGDGAGNLGANNSSNGG